MNIDEVLVFSGPSGVGKSYAARCLAETNKFETLLSSTTRAPRPGEIHLVDYEFLTDLEYQGVSDDVLIQNEILGAYYLYRRSALARIFAANKIPVAIVYPSALPGFLAKCPRAFSMFFRPTDRDLLRRRLEAREANPAKVRQRLEALDRELADYEPVAELYQSVVNVGDDVDVRKVFSVIAERYQLHGVLRGL